MPVNQASAFFRITVGEVEVTAVSDGVAPFPMDQLLEGASPSTVDKELKDSFVAEPYPTSVNTFLLRHGDRLMLIDTGAGNTLGSALGKLPSNLVAAGHKPEEIQDVYLSHLHMDHDGGLTLGTRETFPNATVHVNAKDIAAWLNPDEASKAGQASASKPYDPKLKFTAANFKDTMAALKPYEDAGKLESFQADTELFPGFRAIAAPGHTPGHTIFELESGGASIVFWGDTVHVAEVQVRDPEVTILFDSDPNEAAKGREQVLLTMAKEGRLIAGSHLPFPGIGHVRSTDGKYHYVPLDYQPAFSAPQS